MVLGEHARFLEPTLSTTNDFRIRDPETGKLLETPSEGAGRGLFGYRIVGLFSNDAGNVAVPNADGKIRKGAPFVKNQNGQHAVPGSCHQILYRN